MTASQPTMTDSVSWTTGVTPNVSQVSDSSSSSSVTAELRSDLEKVKDNWPYLWLVLLIALSLGGNSAVIVVVHRSPRLHTLLHYLLASLAAAHVLTALAVVPLALASELLESFPWSREFCNAWLGAETILLLCCLTHLGLAIYSCRAALLRPLRYKLRAAVRYIGTQLGLAWVLAMLLASPYIVTLLAVDRDEGTLHMGCRPHQRQHTLAYVLPTFYVPVVLLCGLYAWTLWTARSRTQLATHLAEATGTTVNSSTSNGDITGLDKLDTELYTMLENGEGDGGGFIAWRRARLQAEAEANGTVAVPHAIITTRPSTEGEQVAEAEESSDRNHLSVEVDQEMQRCNETSLASFPAISATQEEQATLKQLPDTDPQGREQGQGWSGNADRSSGVAEDGLGNPDVVQHEQDPLGKPSLVAESTGPQRDAAHHAPISEDPTDPKADNTLTRQTQHVCDSILKALEGNELDASESASKKGQQTPQRSCLVSNDGQYTPPKSQRASKELLNEPLEEQSILVELEKDTRHLLDQDAVPERLLGVVNPVFTRDTADTESVRSSENGDGPLCKAIRVKHQEPESHSEHTDGRDNEEGQAPGAAHCSDASSHHSSISGSSGFSGARRSILRRNGSKRGASTKSVKFSSKVETKVVSKQRNPSKKSSGKKSKSKSKKAEATPKNTESSAEESTNEENKAEESGASAEEEQSTLEKNPGTSNAIQQYQVVHRGRVANGSMRNPHRMRLANGKLAISGTSGVDPEMVVDYLTEVQRRQGIRISRRVREQREALKLLGVVFAVYAVLLLPHFLLSTLLGICQSCRENIADGVITALHWLALATCMVNPPIYCIVSPVFRRSLKKTCCCCCCCRQG